MVIGDFDAMAGSEIAVIADPIGGADWILERHRCQLYLPAASTKWIQMLAEHGCVYVYAGIESASEDVQAAIGKPKQDAALILERAKAIDRAGMQAGFSLMFGCMSASGVLLETEATLSATLELTEEMKRGTTTAPRFYPNIQTILPGTALAQSLEAASIHLDFYRQPRTEVFSMFEDGGIGHNFATRTVLTEVSVDLPDLLAKVPQLFAT
jgi:hypothetical protein